MDSVTGAPILLRNDDDMNGIFVYGFDTAKGVELYIDTVKNLTGTRLVDVFLGTNGARAPIRTRPLGPIQTSGSSVTRAGAAH